MVETILAFLNSVWVYVVDLFSTNVTALPVYRILIAAAIVVIGLYIVKWVLKLVKAGLKAFGKMLKALFTLPKRKCEKIQCPSCGRNLANCVCEKNKKRSYTGRLLKYKKEHRK